MDKISKCGKIVLSVLYVLFLVNLIVNKSLEQLSMSTTSVSARIITFCLSFLLAGGAFLLSTAIQAVVYGMKNRVPNNSVIISVIIIVFETVKIIFTALYFYLIDCQNIYFGRPDTVLVSGFLLSGIIIFVITVVCEIALFTFEQLNKIKQAAGE